MGPTTALRYGATVRNHIVADRGRRELRSLNKPSIIQGWIRTGFGFAIEDVDFKGGWMYVNRQVQLFGMKPVFALPKGNKIRPVSLSAQLATALLP